jgi:hypothetical protein
VAGYPSYPAYPAHQAGAPLQPASAGPAPVRVAVPEPAPQRRATVAFRLILVIPHLFLLACLTVAAFVIAFLGWWGALFTGLLPEFAANYLTGFTRWNLRVQAYLYLLTDAYPPFTLDEVPYPVRLMVPERQRLNPAAVFFRFVLGIPAWVVAATVIEGAGSVLLFVAWLVTLIGGCLPRALHQALAAVLRYQIRMYSYYWMLTPAYPWGLFGDAPAGFSGGPGYPPPEAGYGTPGYGTAASVYGGYGPNQTVFEPASWQLVLSSAARRLVVLILVLGVLTYVVDFARVGAALHKAQNITTANNAIDKLDSVYGTLTGEMGEWEARVTACDQNLGCVTKADGNAATYFATFASDVRATPMPPGSASAANQVSADATQIAREYTELSQATNASQYETTFNRIGLQQTINHFDQDFAALGTALNNT